MNNRIEILNRAIAALKNKLPGQEVSLISADDFPRLEIMGKVFLCMVEPSLTVADLMRPNLEPEDTFNGNITLFVTINASDKVLELAQKMGVNVIDCAGNYALRNIDTDGKLIFMFGNRGETPVTDIHPNSYPIFREKGLRMIFYLLLAKENISKSYREIHEATGVALGTVKNIVDGMIYQQFVRIEKNKRFLINIDKLLMLWSANYCQTLRPKLFLARMKFRHEDESGWETLELPSGMQWGGEAASALTDKYLTPGSFTIYSAIPAPAIISTGKVEPALDGNLFIYKKFWKEEIAGICVPPVLTYADLMDTGNGRCIEAAQRMKENELEYLFR